MPMNFGEAVEKLRAIRPGVHRVVAYEHKFYSDAAGGNEETDCYLYTAVDGAHRASTWEAAFILLEAAMTKGTVNPAAAPAPEGTDDAA